MWRAGAKEQLIDALPNGLSVTQIKSQTSYRAPWCVIRTSGREPEVRKFNVLKV